MATVQSSNDDEPFIPPACTTPAVLADVTGLVDVAVRHDADVADEEVVVSTTEDLLTDQDELAAEKAAEKMIERRIQVCFRIGMSKINRLTD